MRAMLPSRLTAEQVLAVAHAHSEAEERCELEPLMATMIAEPVFEFHPPGARLVGGARIRRHYEQFLTRFMALVEGTELMGQWVTETASVQEYRIDLRIDGKLERHGVVAVLYASGDRLGGERLYGSERLLDLMLGPDEDRAGAPDPLKLHSAMSRLQGVCSTISPVSTTRPSESMRIPPFGIRASPSIRKKSGRPSAKPTGKRRGSWRWWCTWMWGSLVFPEFPHLPRIAPSSTRSPTRTPTLPGSRCASTRKVPPSISSTTWLPRGRIGLLGGSRSVLGSRARRRGRITTVPADRAPCTVVPVARRSPGDLGVPWSRR